MRYKKAKIDYKLPLEIWAAFKDEEKIMIYDTGKQDCIIGINSIDDRMDIEEKFTFYTVPFDDKATSTRWSTMTDVKRRFRIYIIINRQESCMYYLGEQPVIEAAEITSKNHSYKFQQDDYETWKNLFHNIKKQLSDHGVEKVVASREVKLECDTPVDIVSVLDKLIHNNKESYVFAFDQKGKVFLGATPEILVQKKANSVTSYAIAGTIAKNGKKDPELGAELLNDPKNRHEHDIVINMIAEKMKHITDRVTIGSTGLMELKNLYHLETKISVEDESLSLLDWVQILHPTPAMGGKPKDKAMAIIKKYEQHDRGLYAAPIGIADERGNGIFVVGIRSALIDKNKIYAYAGCGLVEQSDCRLEYREINNKLQTILECL